jgi:hypothetical protein
LLKEVKNIFSKYYQMIKLPFKIFKQACEMLELLDHKQFLLVSLPHFLSPFLPPLFPSIKHLFLHVHMTSQSLACHLCRILDYWQENQVTQMMGANFKVSL